jgi:predicted house-cleaning noncanonical NTP pyrophosphatase (MazG superfamily)
MITHNKDDIVVLKIFNDSFAANLAQNKLQEEGIESFLVDENVVGLNPLGGVELKIFSRDLEKAKKILSEIKFS